MLLTLYKLPQRQIIIKRFKQNFKAKKPIFMSTQPKAQFVAIYYYKLLLRFELFILLFNKIDAI